MTHKRFFAIITFLFTLLSACETPFSYSIYDANIPKKYKGTTQDNLLAITKLAPQVPDTFTVALLADVHYHYTELDAAVKFINQHSDIVFVIIIGELTDQGLCALF